MGSVNKILVSTSLYNKATFAAFVLSKEPIIILSGLKKSLNALPSLRNSGLNTAWLGENFDDCKVSSNASG